MSPSAPLLGRLAGAVDAGRLLLGGRLRTPGAVVFAYHDVGDDPANTTDYYVSPAQMREHIVLARSWGIEFVDLADLTDRYLAGQPVDGLGAIVFDDSLVGVHHHAMPVLLDLGAPATVFTVSDALGTSPAWWSGAARVMTRGEVDEMAAAGFRIASHTRSHASLPSLEGVALADEVAGSRARLEDMIGGPVDILAYPFGHYSPAVVDATVEAGYRAAYSFLNGRLVAGLDRYKLPRLNMFAGQTKARLAYHLARPPSSWPDTQLDTVLHAER